MVITKHFDLEVSQWLGSLFEQPWCSNSEHHGSEDTTHMSSWVLKQNFEFFSLSYIPIIPLMVKKKFVYIVIY